MINLSLCNRRLNANIMKIVIIALLAFCSLQIVPTAPITASPNTQSSPAKLIFSFKLDKPMLTSSYLMIVFPIFSTSITPYTCTLLGSTYTSTSCNNLNTASLASPNPLTINNTVVNNINPNIQTIVTIVTSFSSTLSAGTSYSLQIVLLDNLPAIGALSQSFEFYVISGTGIMQEQNWNMGQLYLQLRNNNLMNMVSINAQNANTPGTTVSTLLMSFTIGVSVPTPMSVFIFTISGNFQFTVSSLVTSIAVTGTPPQVQSMEVVSQNIIRVTFSEQFTVGRQFRLSISNIYNPLQISQGAVSIYSLPYNSITPLEISELSIPFQTVSFTPTLSILTAEGISPSAPIQFYSLTVQYITVTILLPRNFDPSFILQIKSDALQFQQGTVYAKTSTVNTNTLQYTLPDLNTIRISGFSTVPSGSLITVTMRVYIDTNPIFNIYVSIDVLSHIVLSAPIIYGTASATVSATPQSYISAFMGSGTQTNKITAMQTATSSISFTITPLFQTLSGSFLQLYTSKYMVADASFSGATSCLVNTVAQPCTLTTNSQYTIITIASGSSFNLFPQSPSVTNIVINQLKFNFASSHSLYLFHFYFQLTVSLATQAVVKKFLATPMVVQQRNRLPSFQMYISNNIYNTGSNFLNTVRLVSSDPTNFQNIIQANQRRMISIFAYQGWTNLFSTLNTYSQYICASNIAVTCTFIRGSNTLNPSSDFPINWDRINIVLPGTETSTKFSIVLPTQFKLTTAISFQIMIGFVDITNGAVTYLNSGLQPTNGSVTQLIPQNILVYSKPKQATMKLNIAGLAGSYVSSVNFTVTPSSSFNGNGYSTCLIVMSSWQFFDSNTVLSATSLASVVPKFENVEQTPLCLKISSTSFMTYIPFKTTALYNSSFDIVFDNIKFPYNLDLPYYSVSLIDSTGSMDGYNQFINAGQNIFYTGVLKNLSISCNDNSLGVVNTYCTVIFTSFQDIEIASTIIITFTGMYVATNLCQFQYTATGVAIPVGSCAPDTNLKVLTLTLGTTTRLPALTSYTLTLNGISIDSSQISQYILLQVMDPTGSYSIQQKSVILMTSVTQNFPIYITQVNFAINNPVVYSSLFMNFTLPRPLNTDQSFALIMSKDFVTLNSITCKMGIRLLQSDGLTQIPTQWVLKYINSQIVFEGLQSILAADTYSLELYGIITPSTITQSMIGIIYQRNYDNTYTKSNNVASTAIFPSLTSKINSLITLQTYFNTQGLQQEMLFTVINQYAQITIDSLWIINFPRYYSPKLWNEDNLIYCMINTTTLPCRRSTYTPYQIELYSSPLIITVGDKYTISVFGIPCPRAAYLNGNSLFITESIFFGVSSSSTATSYFDYSQLFVSNAIINPQTVGGYGSIILQQVTSSNLQVFQTSFFTITLICNVAIPTNSWIYIVFPKEFNNFNNIPVIIQTEFSSNVQVSSSSPVINTRIGFTLSTLSIPANTQFKIKVTSLLTPKNAVTINMNLMKVIVASSDKLTTIASSIQSKNQLSTMTFIPNTLYVSVNSGNVIQVTAGTYSNPIQLVPSDGNYIQTNMMITFSSTQLTFSPNPAYMYIGDYYSTFIIGASQNLIPTTYTFNLVKKETSISSYYSALSQYAIVVSSVPISITLPASFNVPIGGCSMPTLISIPNAPYSNLIVNFEFDTSIFTPQKFWMNQQISYQQLSFDLNNTHRWLSFCSSSTQTIATFTITMKLGGDNAASYLLSSSTLTINIINLAAQNIAPTFTLSAVNIQKSYSNFMISTNIPGQFYYHLRLAPLSAPLDISIIKTDVKANTLVLQSNKDYLNVQIYSNDRDERVGFYPVTIAGNNYLNINDLLPERDYVLCGYFENAFGAIANYRCINFTTQTWGTVRKAIVTFTSPVLANDLNNVLCFFVRGSSSEINQIVNSDGNSCALKTSAQNYYYNYKGNSTTNQFSSTIIYHLTNPNLTSDASISAFNNLFSGSGLTASSLTLAQSQFSITFFSSTQLLTSFSPMTAMKIASSSFQPSFSFIIGSFDKSSSQVQITNIQSSLPSTLYFILVSYKNITTNQISSKTNITIKPLITPTASQAASCVDGAGNDAVQCFRVVIQAGKKYSFTLTNMQVNSVYALQYAIANEYPTRPIFYGGVSTQFISTVSWESFNFIGLLAIILGLLMIV